MSDVSAGPPSRGERVIKLANTAMNTDRVHAFGLIFKLDYCATPEGFRLVVFPRCARAEREEWDCYGPGSYACVQELPFRAPGETCAPALFGRSLRVTYLGRRLIDVWYARTGASRADEFEFRVELLAGPSTQGGDPLACDPDCRVKELWS